MKVLNYGHIKRALLKSFSNIELIDSPARGVVACFGEIGDERVRIVLVGAEEYKSEVGIHINRIENKEELEARLVDAVETAMKDNFPTIWVHRSVEYTAERRERKLATLMPWIESMRKRVDSNHSLNKLHTEIEQTLESMSGEQIECVLALIVASSTRAHGESREWWSKSYHELRAELATKAGA